MLGKLFRKKKDQSNVPKESVQERTFILETYHKKYTGEEVTALLLEEIINSDVDTWEFMVLIPSKPIKGSDFMQTDCACFPHFLEVSFGSKQYQLETTDKNIILQHLTAYLQEERIPDTFLWKDISDRVSSPN